MSRVDIQIIDLDDHENSKKYIFKKDNGFQVTLLSYGASILSILYPDKDKNVEEVTLNYSTIADIKKNPGPYYGCTVGRFANRIKHGKFKIDDQEYSLAINNGVNALHGGVNGFDKKYWLSELISDTGYSDDVGVKFTCFSADGEEGYPGNLNVSTAYLISKLTDKITILYKAELVPDGNNKSTIVNLTNHTYFNLSGNCKHNIKKAHRLRLYCSKFLPIDETMIPTGELKEVDDTLYDFTFSAVNAATLSGRHVIQVDGSSNTIEPLNVLISRGILGEPLDSIDDIDGRGMPGLDHCFLVDGYAITGKQLLLQ